MLLHQHPHPPTDYSCLECDFHFSKFSITSAAVVTAPNMYVATENMVPRSPDKPVDIGDSPIPLSTHRQCISYGNPTPVCTGHYANCDAVTTPKYCTLHQFSRTANSYLYLRYLVG